MLPFHREVTAMIPIPHDGGIPSISLFVNGYLDLLMVLSLVGLVLVFAVMLWAARSAGRRRELLLCPVRLRRAGVLFRLAPNGARTDVIRCSVFGRRPITCGKACIQRTNGV
jgi:hypothetical protein